MGDKKYILVRMIGKFDVINLPDHNMRRIGKIGTKEDIKRWCYHMLNIDLNYKEISHGAFIKGQKTLDYMVFDINKLMDYNILDINKQSIMDQIKPELREISLNILLDETESNNIKQ